MAFKVFDTDEKIENLYSTIAEPMWSGDLGTLTTFFTGSVQNSNTGKYYNDVHITSDQDSDVQFSVTYGHRLGSGSEGSTTAGTTNPTKGIHSQLRQVLLPAGSTRFNFSGGGTTNYYSDDVFAVVAVRARYRERMDPGNWELHLQSGSGANADTIRLIDDSGAGADPTIGDAKREFWVVSGSVANGIYETAATRATVNGSGSYGLFYPELGMVLLNPGAIASGSGKHSSAKYVEPVGTSASTNDLNHRKLFNSVKSGSYFAARREEKKRSSFYFCRVPNKEFNFSSNPSFATASDGSFTQSTFFKNPKTFITQVGLYNDDGELLAIAKLSKPLLKSYSREAIVKVKLDF